MTAQLQHIVQKLFSRNSLEDVSLEELQAVVNKYPYYNLGHFLLWQKQKRLNDETHHTTAKKTSLYFQDPLWLQWLMEEMEELKEVEEINHATSQQFNDSATQQLNDSTTQPLNDSATQPLNDSTTPPAFEPYHTIDYFASQGIKISNEIKPDDKFGQQLKSFTEWLKTMKRFPQPKADDEVDEIEKSHIREIAEHSLEGKEVVTEAMAEVLLKQHRTEEARKVYEKLSLLNPSKSAYFAAKIEQLKEN